MYLIPKAGRQGSGILLIVLAIMIFLLPIQRINLPWNMGIVDLWNVLLFIVVGRFVSRTKQKLVFPHALPIWVIIVASLISLINAADIGAGILAIIREIYLYSLFVVLVLALTFINEAQIKSLLEWWLFVCLAHGVLLILQFIFPDFLIATSVHVSKYVYRPLGVTSNPNMAAAFQLAGIVPLLLLHKNRFSFMADVTLLFFSVLATGSFGGSLAMFISLIAFGLLFLIYSPDVKSRFNIFIVFSMLVVIGLVIFRLILRQPEFQSKLHIFFVARFEHSMTSRLRIWEEGLLASSRENLKGVGIGNFRDSVFNDRPHNDFLGFWIERGLLGIIGLSLFGLSIFYTPVKNLLKMESRDLLWQNIVFFAANLAFLTVSATHEIFHFRFVWLTWALQYRMLNTAPH